LHENTGFIVAKVSKKDASSGLVAVAEVIPEPKVPASSVSNLTQTSRSATSDSVAYLPHIELPTASNSAPESVPDITTDPVPQIEGEVKGRTRTGLPLPPGLKVIPATFYKYLAILQPNDWAHAVLYVQDIWPVTVRSPKYIGKLKQSIDDEYIRNYYGSGTYVCRLNDTAIPGTRRTICECTVVFRDSDCPPKRNLVDMAIMDPENKEYRDYLIREGLINPKGEIMNTGNTSAAASENVALKLADALIDKSGANDPFRQFLVDQLEAQRKETAELRKLLLDQQQRINSTPPPAPAAAGSDTMFQFMQSQLKAANDLMAQREKQEHELRLERLKHPEGGGSGKGMSIKEWMELEKSVEDRILRRVNGASAETDDSWMGVAKSYAPAVNNIASAFVARLTTPAAAAGASAAELPAELPAAAAAGGVNLEGEVQEMQTVFDECVEMMKSQGSHLVGAIQRGETGDSFARQLAAVIGAPGLLAVADYGTDILNAAIVEVPELKRQLAGRQAQLLTFINAFVEYADTLRPSESAEDKSEGAATA
jgi:hypothetical protein